VCLGFVIVGHQRVLVPFEGSKIQVGRDMDVHGAGIIESAFQLRRRGHWVIINIVCYNEAGRQSQGNGGYHRQTVPLRSATPRASLDYANLQILSHITLQT
jgi:hypothetical protein